MKQVKWLLGVLLGATWASAWWASAFLVNYLPWVFPIILTILISISAFVYIANNWNDE